MAVMNSRSQRLSLMEGATDGRYRKVRPDTIPVAGMGNEQVVMDRKDLNPLIYSYIVQEVPLVARGIPGM